MSANLQFILGIKPSTTTNEERCLQVSNMDQSTLWHHRYGHLGYKGLCTLKHKNMVKGLPQIGSPNTTCEACIKEKQHRTPFPKMGKWRAMKKWTGENIEIDKNTAEGGGITEETTEPVAETIEPVAENKEGKITEETTKSVAKTIEPAAENNFPVTVAQNLTIREGRNRYPPVWLADSGEGYEKKGSEEMVYKLQKALYELKQAPRTWFS